MPESAGAGLVRSWLRRPVATEPNEHDGADQPRADVSRAEHDGHTVYLGPDTPICEACNQPTPHTLPRRPTVNDDYTINVGSCCDPDLHETCEHTRRT